VVSVAGRRSHSGAVADVPRVGWRRGPLMLCFSANRRNTTRCWRTSGACRRRSARPAMRKGACSRTPLAWRAPNAASGERMARRPEACKCVMAADMSFPTAGPTSLGTGVHWCRRGFLVDTPFDSMPLAVRSDFPQAPFFVM
jgi:hypothetical protein